MKATKNIVHNRFLAFSNAPRVALLFFVVAGVLGAYMKAGLEFGFAFSYDHTLHAHSHLAFQGWVYLALFYVTTNTFLSASARASKRVSLQYTLTVVLLLGIGWAFLYEGYGAYSITLSTLFQVLNWAYAYTILSERSRFVRNTPLATLALKSSVAVGVLSTLFPFAIGAVSALGLANSELYNALIYTFLHLQYNGWFFLGALSVLLFHYEALLSTDQQKHIRTALLVYLLVLVPSISLSLLNMSVADFMWPAALVSAGGLLYMLRSVLVVTNTIQWKQLNVAGSMLLATAVLAFVGKTLLQSLSVVPALTEQFLANRYFIIAFIHTCTIGVLSTVLMFLFAKQLEPNKRITMGIVIFLSGFALSQAFLVCEGMKVDMPAVAAVVVTAAMPIGLFVVAQANPTTEVAS